MIDKSKQEMAAVRQLKLTGDATDFLLCYFHFLQEWERFARSSESGVIGKARQHRLLCDLAELARIRSPSLFEAQVGQLGRLSWLASSHLSHVVPSKRMLPVLH